MADRFQRFVRALGDAIELRTCVSETYLERADIVFADYVDYCNHWHLPISTQLRTQIQILREAGLRKKQLLLSRPWRVNRLRERSYIRANLYMYCRYLPHDMCDELVSFN